MLGSYWILIKKCIFLVIVLDKIKMKFSSFKDQKQASSLLSTVMCYETPLSWNNCLECLK